jgi:hypothetical protein
LPPLSALRPHPPKQAIGAGDAATKADDDTVGVEETTGSGIGCPTGSGITTNALARTGHWKPRLSGLLLAALSRQLAHLLPGSRSALLVEEGYWSSSTLTSAALTTSGETEVVKVSAAAASNTTFSVSPASAAEAKFLRLAHEGGCKIFSTVLGPEAKRRAPNSFASGPSRAKDAGLQIGLTRLVLRGWQMSGYWHIADIDLALYMSAFSSSESIADKLIKDFLVPANRIKRCSLVVILLHGALVGVLQKL